MTADGTAIGGLQIDPFLVINALVIFVGAYLLSRGLAFLLDQVAERSPRRRISIKMGIPVTKFLVYGAAVYFVLGPLLRLSTSQLLAVSGLLGAALGFGLKDLFAGVIGGFVLLTERPYQVGDKVAMGDHYGEVTSIGLRATTLQTPDDTAVRVPNASLFTEHVANANDGAPEMLVVVEVAVAPGTDVERASDIVEEALLTSRYVYVDEDHPVAVLVEDEAYYRTIRGKAYVADLRDEFAFESDVTKRSLAAFEEQGIETPSVHVAHRSEAGP